MTNLTSIEKRAIFSLSSIMGLRMLGLFMALPVFSLYALQLKGATPTLAGLAMGIYGLSQAIFQIPFGSLSDRFGRKPIILMGLLLFALGSVVASLAHTMYIMLIGRGLQGMGAIGSTLLAMLADLTREEQRTKSMAIAGMTIGLSFSIAMLCGPLLVKWISVSDIFLLASLLAFFCIVILMSVPTPINLYNKQLKLNRKTFIQLLSLPELIKLNISILILHTVFTASFVVIPLSLLHFLHLPVNKQWTLYVPTLLIAFIISLFCMQRAEQKKQVKAYFLIGIVILSFSLLLLWKLPIYLFSVFISLTGFFTGFSLLESFLPSLVSRIAPIQLKGSALGIYSCAQFLGIFIGGIAGGWLYGKFNISDTYLFCVALTLFWLILAFYMQPPNYSVTTLLHISTSQWELIATQLHAIPGIKNITFVAEDEIAYLCIDPNTKSNPDFIRLINQIPQQSSK